ncbi:MAG: COX15/CtaA family protein, partial [Actinomycetota bacterium]|nr:COX15/CtaA family protein [Actinomycetota bacterium]
MALPRITPSGYRRVTLFALVALGFIVVTGAAVRLTGSGLGCTDWPTCEQGRLAPSEITDAPAMIEFANRLVTGLVSVAVILAVAGALRRVPRRRDLVWLAAGLVAGVLAQIVLGGLVVLFELSPRLVMGHFLLSMVILWNATVLHHRAARPDG